MLTDFSLQQFAQNAGDLLDATGVIVILLGAIISTSIAAVTLFKHKNLHSLYTSYRHNLARSILVGLEFLVAGDIIRSVAGELTLDSVLILAIIVVIRSLLSIEFEMEIDGRWPWKRAKPTKPDKISESH